MAESATSWTVQDDLAERSRFKEYHRKHPREYAACFSNLSRLLDLLRDFGGVKGFQVGFLRSERQGVYRIGQTGVKNARETRLYVYIDESKRVVRVLTIGDKGSQSDDIRRCHAIARKLKGGRG